jgi:hypothetical protein
MGDKHRNARRVPGFRAMADRTTTALAYRSKSTQ